MANEITLSPLEIRKGIFHLEARMRELPEVMHDDCFPLKHNFAEGMYIREIFVPAGTLVVTKIHKHSHPTFVLKGKCSVLTEKGAVRIKPPCYMITPAGTKRVVYVHEDTVWVTCHATKETDIKKIEDEIITKPFNIEAFRKQTKKIIAAEKDGFWSDWTPEQQQLYLSGNWEAFSKSRGYSDDEIADFRKWLEMKEEGDRQGAEPLSTVIDLTTTAAIKNIEKDIRGEILLSSHIPTLNKEKIK